MWRLVHSLATAGKMNGKGAGMITTALSPNGKIVTAGTFYNDVK
jgi:hypothetical protein